MNVTVGSLPVTEHRPLRPRRCDGQLERRVKVMLLFIGAMNHLSSSDHQESGVAQVTGVELVTPPIQDHDAGRAAA